MAKMHAVLEDDGELETNVEISIDYVWSQDTLQISDGGHDPERKTNWKNEISAGESDSLFLVYNFLGQN